MEFKGGRVILSVDEGGFNEEGFASKGVVRECFDEDEEGINEDGEGVCTGEGAGEGVAVGAGEGVARDLAERVGRGKEVERTVKEVERTMSAGMLV